MIPKLGKVQRINVRDAWPNEASHFTPWLASEEGLELLQDVLGIELEVEAMEKFVGRFRADILAKRTDTTDDHWVLIENQLERTDHNHLGQLLTYAAGLDAATIVWVAESFDEKHRKALDWLNDKTSDEFEFFGLEVQLWQIAGSPPAPMLSVIAQPNEWSREVKQSANENISDLRQKQQHYWQSLRDTILDRKSKVRPQKALPQSWTTYALGRSNTWLGACMNTQTKSVWVEFCCSGSQGKQWFDELLAHKDSVEKGVGERLDWRRLDGKKMSKIVLQLDGADLMNDEDWPRQHAWLADKLELFNEVFRPLVLTLSGVNEPSGMIGDDIGIDELEGSQEV